MWFYNMNPRLYPSSLAEREEREYLTYEKKNLEDELTFVEERLRELEKNRRQE